MPLSATSSDFQFWRLQFRYRWLVGGVWSGRTAPWRVILPWSSRQVLRCRLVIDYVAKSLRLPLLSAFLDALGSNFTHGWFHHQTPKYHPSLKWVQSLFLKCSMIFIVGSGLFTPRKYTFDIGQNDLTAGLNLTVDEVRASVPDIVGQFKTVIKDIYDQGGRSFWIHNTGPFGCLPYVLDRQLTMAGQIDKYGCVGPFNKLAQFFNHRLKQTVDQLQEELPKAAITYVDVYSVKYAPITQATRNGFEHPFRACCGHGGKYNFNKHIGYGGKVKVKGKDVLVGKACEDPTVMINWDGVHYSQAANIWIFLSHCKRVILRPANTDRIWRFACHKQILIRM